MDLRGKVCLITGGTSGIGAATALGLARQGAQIAIAARKEPSDKELVSAMTDPDKRVSFFRFDAADSDACRSCIREVVEKFGGLDVLVHSAGGPVPGSLQTVTEEDWMHAFAVHVHAIFHLVRAATPYMSRRGGGGIVLLGSAAGLRGCLGAFAYGVVKGALPQLARNLARELADENIRVNCVSPGVIRTPFHSEMSEAQRMNNLTNRIPLHREGQPKDVADLIVALAQNEFITGENVVIDGGLTMRIV